MKKEERLQHQKDRLQLMKRYENQLYSEGLELVAGVDEVGRGPLAGPVVAAAVILPLDFDVLGVDDSKKLSIKRREELCIKIKELSIACGIGCVDNEIIDQINILEATKIAMKEALIDLEKNLRKKKGQSACGIQHVLIDALTLSELSIPQTAIIGGDGMSISIAAASIVAKVTRDKMMVDYSVDYPGYFFENNKGYGTKAHYEGIKAQGLCPIHRRTFCKGARKLNT
jgi:ribonuclease HII